MNAARGLSGFRDSPPWWTPADAAEFDVLIYEVARGMDEHRQKCDACNPEPCPVLASYREHRATCWKCSNSIKVATKIYGEPCPHYAEFISHGGACARCKPCPGMTRAITLVAEWRHVRALASRAEWLRRQQDERAAA